MFIISKFASETINKATFFFRKEKRWRKRNKLAIIARLRACRTVGPALPKRARFCPCRLARSRTLAFQASNLGSNPSGGIT